MATALRFRDDRESVAYPVTVAGPLRILTAFHDSPGRNSYTPGVASSSRATRGSPRPASHPKVIAPQDPRQVVGGIAPGAQGFLYLLLGKKIEAGALLKMLDFFALRVQMVLGEAGLAARSAEAAAPT